MSKTEQIKALYPAHAWANPSAGYWHGLGSHSEIEIHATSRRWRVEMTTVVGGRRRRISTTGKTLEAAKGRLEAKIADHKGGEP